MAPNTFVRDTGEHINESTGGDINMTMPSAWYSEGIFSLFNKAFRYFLAFTQHYHLQNQTSIEKKLQSFAQSTAIIFT